MNYNPVGFITLYKKEVQRFTKIAKSIGRPPGKANNGQTGR